MTAPAYVKASATTVSVEKTQTAIMAALKRYGAHGFGFRRVMGTAVTEVTFQIAVDGAERTIRIPVDVDRVRGMLEAMGRDRARREKKSTKVSQDQAERVTWRVLLNLIEAALAAAAIGAQTLEEAFFAHVEVTTDDGQKGRVIDYLHSIEAFSATPGLLPRLGGTWQKQLGPG